MANPQVEKGHIRIANDLQDAFCAIRIPGEARQVLDVIIRKTYGWGKKKDNISLSQFCEATGIQKRNVMRAINKLLKMNIVIKKDNGKLINYSIQKDYDKWVPLHKKTGGVQKDRGCPKRRKGGVQKDVRGVSKKTPTINTITKDTITKDNTFLKVFIFWNESKIVIHRDMKTYKTCIGKALKSYSEEEITQSIRNFAIVLHSDEYFWSVSWTLKEFLSKGLEKFLDVNKPLERFRRYANGNKKTQRGFTGDTKKDYVSGWEELGFTPTIMPGPQD